MTDAELQRERRALIVVIAALAVLFAAGVWASLQPVPVPAFFGGRLLTNLQVYALMESRLSGPGCGALLQGARVTIEGQYAEVSLPALGRFEVQSRHFPSGNITVRPLGPVNHRDDCRFDSRYTGPIV
jgi:hypothetical protein